MAWHTIAMGGGGLTSQDIQEALSEALLKAIAANAGFCTSKQSIDRDGIDMTVHGYGNGRPNIGVQLKASTNLQVKKGVVKYPLYIRNYNLLRGKSQIPRMLVLMRMPKKQSEWLSSTDRLLSLRHCAYWMCLEDAPPVTNGTKITIDVPAKNLLTTQSLVMLMDRSRSGTLL